MKNKEMIYIIGDYRIIQGFQKFLQKHELNYFIIWKPCAVAEFHINVHPADRYGIDLGLYEIEYNTIMK